MRKDIRDWDNIITGNELPADVMKVHWQVYKIIIQQ
jgi:hypothetical protein